MSNTPRRGDWMQTYTGRQFWPLDPLPDDVTLEDVAHHLSMRVRYSGAAKRFYSVAEHSVVVSLYVAPEHAREALLHDASEAYLGDMIRPLKYQPEFAEFRRIETHLEDLIYERFGVVRTPESRAAVKRIDDRILVDERLQIMSTPPKAWPDTGPALGANLACMLPGAAEFVFVSRFLEVFPEWRDAGQAILDTILVNSYAR